MVGHKWLQVQHSKGEPLGVKRGAAFHKPVKQLTVATHFGGGKPSGISRTHPGTEATTRTTQATKDHRNRISDDQRIIFSKDRGEQRFFPVPPGRARVPSAVRRGPESRNRSVSLPF